MDRNETVRISRLAAFDGLTESDASIVECSQSIK